MNSIDIPSPEEFRRGVEAYQQNERRGCAYFDALSKVSNSWGNSAEMAKGIALLIRSWNRFYAKFDLDKVADCITRNSPIIDAFRNRHITSLSNDDGETILALFDQFLNALQRIPDNQKSAVSVAKTFGLLAPDFLPIWDSTIAWRYGCLYGIVETASSKYVAFCWKMKELSENVRDYECARSPNPKRSLLKMIDEYNYSKFTAEWI